MSKAEIYLRAGTSENTRNSYRAAVEHFEVTWGGYLPATGDAIVRYLANYAGQHSISTLKQRLAGLAQWHITQGFPDPTKTPDVRRVLKGIRAVHPAQAKQAAPLLLQHLEQAIGWLENEATAAYAAGNHKAVVRYRRDIALVLIGFWRGFRSDELTRLQVEFIQAQPGEGMTLFLPQSKGDREYLGKTFQTPALIKLCPVDAYVSRISTAGLVGGPVFRGIDRWGNLSETAVNPKSLIPMLRRVFSEAGLPAELYSSHSLRRGFATWASANGWDLKGLMSYVGWKDMKSALRYVDSTVSFGGLAAKGSRTPSSMVSSSFPSLSQGR